MIPFIELPIKKKIENKIVFYFDASKIIKSGENKGSIFYKGSVKLRVIQICNELIKNNVDNIICIPSLHGGQLNSKTNKNIFEYIHNCIVFFVKYPVKDYKKGVEILTMLINNNNKLIYDYIDTRLLAFKIKETIHFYDKIIFMDDFTKNLLEELLPDIKHKTKLIEHHYDPEIDLYCQHDVNIIEPKIYYFGNPNKTHLFKYFKHLGVIFKGCWSEDYFKDSIAHVCLRNKNGPISHIKLGNCVAMNSIPIINKGVYDDFFYKNYPYELNELTDVELERIIKKVKYDYLNKTPDWINAQEHIKIIKDKLSIKHLIRKYISVLNDIPIYEILIEIIDKIEDNT